MLVLACFRLLWFVSKIFTYFSVFVSSSCLVAFCSKLFSFVVSGALTCLQVAVFWIFLRSVKFLRMFFGSSCYSVCFLSLVGFPGWFRLCLVVFDWSQLFELDG